MALSTLQRLKLVAPEFESSHSDAELNDYITLAAEQISASVFGAQYQQAVAYLAAHTIELAENQNGAPGPLTSQRAGAVSESYGSQASDDEYDTTSYGREFKRIRRGQPDTHAMTTHSDFG